MNENTLGDIGYQVPEIIDEYMSTIGDQINYYQDQPKGFKPIPGSRGATELSVIDLSITIQIAYDIGNMLIELAGEHMYSFARAISNKVLALAPWSIVRNILEICSIGLWLFDPEISPSTRCNRCYSLKYKGYDEYVKFVRSTNDKKALEIAMNEKSLFIEKAKKNGYKVFTDDKEHPRGIGVRFPQSTTFVKDQLNGEMSYRLYSAMLHGHEWAIRNLGFSFSQHSNDGDRLYEKKFSPEKLYHLSEQSINSYHYLLQRKFHIYGWEMNIINDKKDSSIKTIYENLSN